MGRWKPGARAYAPPVAGRLIAGVVAAAAALALAGGDRGEGGVARAQDAACPAVAYPGDAAPPAAIAQWMAYGAGLAALPRELPVMAALVESGMANVQTAGADSAGYFQMRMSVWNQGAYAGFPQNPDLQLRWFLDQAAQVRSARIAAGMPDPAAAEAGYGAWIADVERPPAPMRDRYQPRLAEARALIAGGCAPTDTIPPRLIVAVRKRQHALHRGAIVITLGCPDEPCTASAFGTLRLPRAHRPPLVFAHTRAIPAGGLRTLRFALHGELRRRVRKALRDRGSMAATLRLRAVDAAGNATAGKRTPRITG